MEKKPLLDGKKPDKWAEIKASLMKKETILLIVYTLLYIICGVVNSLLLRKVMTSFQNYPFFLGQLTNYGYIPIFGAVVLYEIYFTSFITKEMRAFPWWKLLVMGALDAVNGYFVVIGGIKTTGPMQNLLNQAIVPVTMAGAFFILKERYTWLQAGGATTIVAGVVLSLVPSLTGSDNSGNSVFWNMFYLCQVIPFAASNVYKDIAFKEVDLDVWYLQFWDVFWQSLVGTLLFPINTILPPPATIKWGGIPKNLHDGGMCLIGKDLITPPACGTKDLACDDCTNAWLILLIYVAVNVAYNVFILLVIKYGSATILSIAQTVRLPITNLCFASKKLAGNDTVPFTRWSLAGLLVILFGLVTYRVGSAMKQKSLIEDGGETRIIPHIGPGGVDYMIEAVAAKPLIVPKTGAHLRRQYLTKLGVGHTNINSSPSPSYQSLA